MTRRDKIYEFIKQQSQILLNSGKGYSAQEIGTRLNLQRNTVSYECNRLVEEGKLYKQKGKPVLFFYITKSETKVVNDHNFFEHKLGGYTSLRRQIDQAKSAILYPPNGLITLITGKSGVGKTFFAHIMYEYAKKTKVLSNNAPFISFNCADYAENKELLVSQLFGYVKGSFTGADKDKAGLVQKAENGILFLDEVHNLSSEGQEILFSLMDQGKYRRFGETENTQIGKVRIICATTTNQSNLLLNTFLRRIPIKIELPDLEDRNLQDRYQLVKYFAQEESIRIGKKLVIPKQVLNKLLFTKFNGNVGELQETIKLLCARAFVKALETNKSTLILDIAYLDSFLLSEVDTEQMAIYQNLDLSFLNSDLLFDPAEQDYKLNSLNKNVDFYQRIKTTYQDYLKNGFSRIEADRRIQVKIEKYYKDLLQKTETNAEKIDLNYIIPSKLLTLLNQFIDKAEEYLQQNFSQEVILGLALHMLSFVERIDKKNDIYNPNLKKIELRYPKQFFCAKQLLTKICQEYNVVFSDDEAAFITMFLIKKNDKEKLKQYQIILLSHGQQIATSVAKAANAMLGNHWIDAIDMPLNTNIVTIEKQLISLTKIASPSKGILLLVDMGSLKALSKKLWEYYDKKLEIGVISGYNMSMVLEIARKISFKTSSFGEIVTNTNYKETIESHLFEPIIQQNLPIIWTSCMTGIGTAKRTKLLIMSIAKKFGIIGKFKIEAVSIENLKGKYLKTKEKPQIIIGYCPTGLLPKVFFMNLTDLFKKEGFFKLFSQLDIKLPGSKLEQARTIQTMVSLDTVLSQITDVDLDDLVSLVEKFIRNSERKLRLKLSRETFMRLLIHVSFMVERILKNKKILAYPNFKSHQTRNQHLYIVIHEELNEIEHHYHIEVPDTEICYLIDIILEN